VLKTHHTIAASLLDRQLNHVSVTHTCWYLPISHRDWNTSTRRERTIVLPPDNFAIAARGDDGTSDTLLYPHCIEERWNVYKRIKDVSRRNPVDPRFTINADSLYFAHLMAKISNCILSRPSSFKGGDISSFCTVENIATPENPFPFGMKK
jgi:hypothetical protein